MATPEGRVKNKVRDILKRHKAYQFWPVQTGYGAATLDCIGCCNGQYFSIETKAPTKKLTPRQRGTALNILAYGGTVFCISGTDGYKQLEDWLNECVIITKAQRSSRTLFDTTGSFTAAQQEIYS